MGEEQQGSGTTEERGGETGWMCCWAVAEADGGCHYTSTGSLISVSH